MSKAIGIDLGTYNSAASVALGRTRVAMVESKYGKTLYGKSFPSFVLFDKFGRVQMVGQRAKEEARLNPDLVVWGVKRLVGLSYRAALEMGEFRRFQYRIEEGPAGDILICVGEERFSPSHILEIILREIKADAENPKVNPLIGGAVDRAIISIPAYYKAIRTGPIVEAARRAGFEGVDTIAEPTAAAVTYSVDVPDEANILAFDMGAGTLDVTIMMVVNEKGELVPGELCTSGHEALGGIDMDDALIAHLAEQHDIPGYGEDAAVKAILKEEVEKAKIRLSTRETTMLDLPGGEMAALSRGEMDEVLAPFLEKCRGPVRVALRQAGIDAASLDHVLCIGGPTHMDSVRRLLREELTALGAKSEVLESLTDWENRRRLVDPMSCVAKGAAFKAEHIVEPVAKVLSEGYGTMYGPVAGKNNFYASILDVNTNYPISARGALAHMDPEALEVPVPLIAKRPDVERSSADEMVYKYEYLGDYNLSITPTGRTPSVDIKLQVTDDKRVVATIIHAHNRQQVRFEGLGHMIGQQIELQEETPPKRISRGDGADIFNDSMNYKKGGWTASHLERHIHVANQSLDLVGDCDDPKVKRAVEEVESAVRKAVASDFESPNIDCPNLSNRIKELLDALRQPGINIISIEEFRHYMDQLIQVAKMGE
jgi:molecular chaperone DnaK (HSP70)